MHWSDPVSVLVAQTVAEAVAALPLALLLTCREERDEATHEVRGRLAELPASVRRVRRRLARLSQPCVSLLAVAAIVAETAAEAIEDDLLQHVSGVRQEAAAG